MAHSAALLNGISGVIIGPATALVSAVWFPIGERTTATGISSAFSQLGLAISYLLSSALIGNPVHQLLTVQDNEHESKETKGHEIQRLLQTKNITVEQLNIRVQIMSLMRIGLSAQQLIYSRTYPFFNYLCIVYRIRSPIYGFDWCHVVST